MNQWYAMAEELETVVSPLDEVTLTRIQRAARRRLPKRRVRLRIASVAAVLLLLTACGVAVVRFGDWFGSLVNPASPAESEDILASIGTVIGQRQTVDGITVTLHGALYDGENFLLSLSVEGLEAEERYSSNVTSGSSWLYYSRADCEKHWNALYPEEEAAQHLLQYDQMTTSMMSWLQISRQFDMDRCLLLLEPVLKPQEGRELVLHLEQLEVMGQQVAGPFEFTFTPEKKTVSQRFRVDRALTAPSGEVYEVTEIVLTPLEVQVYVRGQLNEQGRPPEITPELAALRLSGTAETWSTGSGSWIGNNGDGTWSGRLYYGVLERILDPADVAAVQIDDTWLERTDWIPEK